MGGLPRGYRVWVGASTASQVGDVGLYLALGWAASAYGGAAVGLVLACITVPRVVLLLPGGSVVDRAGPRRVLLVSDGLLLAVSAVAAVVALLAGTPLWLLVALALALGSRSCWG